MTQQTFAIPQNSYPTNVALADALNILKKDIMLNFNCHAIGTIQAFNSDQQTATVTINYQKTILLLDESTETYVPTLLSYPTLLDCPVLFLGGGSSYLTFPIANGDECLVFFNDRDIDNWFSGSNNGPVATPRLHSFSDAVVLVGIRSLDNVIDNFDTTRTIWANGETIVGLSSSLIAFQNASYTLKGLLQELVNNVNDLVTAVGDITVLCAGSGSPSGTPINASQISAVATELASTNSKIAGLLDNAI